MNRAPRICVVGYLSIDTISTAGQTLAEVPGGAALYAALGARAAGASVSVVACIGEDYPRRWLMQMAALDIDVSRVKHKSGATRRAILNNLASGDRVSAHHDHVDWWERTVVLAPEPVLDVDADYLVLAPMSPELAMRMCKSAQCPALADTSAAYARLDTAGMMSLLPHLSCFAPSLEESRILLPAVSDSQSLRQFAATGPDVVQKRGAAGLAVCASGSQSIRLVRALPTNQIDPTGAGDATVGALAVGLAKGLSLYNAATQAAVIGARAVSGPGPSALDFTWHDQPHELVS